MKSRRTIERRIHTACVFVGACMYALIDPLEAGGNIESTSTGFIPLTEPGAAGLHGEPGGLYPGASNQIPTPHLADGHEQAALIQPLAADGTPSPTGKIGILGIGMSNGALVFERLRSLMDGLWNSEVVFVQGAQGMMDASVWAEGENSAWNVVQTRLADAGITAAQVQVVINIHAVAHSRVPPQPWPDTPDDLRQFHETIAGHLAAKFPNTRLSFWGTREYGGYATTVNNPEPYAYRSGYAVQWMIARQIDAEPELNFHPDRGTVRVPWMDWGPYPWADGMTPRGDGLFWEARDFQADGIHPTRRGEIKLAEAWARMFRTSPLLAPWAVPVANHPPLCDIVFPSGGGTLPMDGPVAIEVFAHDVDGEVEEVEVFVNGASLEVLAEPPFSMLWQPPAKGDYTLHAVARDDSGATRDSPHVLARIRAPQPADTGELASDSFESSDFFGGGGWVQDEWIIGGTPNVIQGAAADGQWFARLPVESSIARAVALTSTADTFLNFSWKAELPAGSRVDVEIRDTEWRTVFSRTAVNTSQWQAESIPLGAWQPSSSFGVRVRVIGASGQADVDFIRIITPTTDEAEDEIRLAIEPATADRVFLSWPGRAWRTYRLETSDDLDDWQPLWHTTAPESSRIGWVVGRQEGERKRFFRVVDIST